MSSTSSAFEPSLRAPSREAVVVSQSKQTHALRYLDKQWPAELHIIPGLIWVKERSTPYKRRLIPRLFGLIMGIILGMRDSIERAVRLGTAPGRAEVERLRAEGQWRENVLLAHTYDYNNGADTGEFVIRWITELVDPASRDAVEAFRWTVPVRAREEQWRPHDLNLARLTRTADDVQELNAHLLDNDLVKRTLIGKIIAAAQVYLRDGRRHSDVLTLSHQFAVSLARFMVTHDNNNKLPRSVS